MKKLENEAYETLKNTIDNFEKWQGINALNWTKYIHPSFSNKKLDKKITRKDLLNNEFVNELTNEELAIIILSWGGMNRKHGKALFDHKEWLNIIENMRSGIIESRKEAYELFQGLRKEGKLTGMGPAYFTKLICFVNPKLNGYIMDQWTSKSINLLFENKLILLNSNGHVTDKNTAEIYEDFCCKIEQLGELLKLSPITLEENLFSNGGLKKGDWRQYVVNNWSPDNKANNIPLKKYKPEAKEVSKSNIGDIKATKKAYEISGPFHLKETSTYFALRIEAEKSKKAGYITRNGCLHVGEELKKLLEPSNLKWSEAKKSPGPENSKYQFENFNDCTSFLMSVNLLIE